MKNVNKNFIRTCLVYDADELSIILSEIFDDAVNVTFCDGEKGNEFDVIFDRYEPECWYDEVIEKLGEYFDIEITSIHIDQCYYPLIWIVYEER